MSQKRYVLSFDALNVIRDFTLFESAELMDLSNWTRTGKLNQLNGDHERKRQQTEATKTF